MGVKLKFRSEAIAAAVEAFQAAVGGDVTEIRVENIDDTPRKQTTVEIVHPEFEIFLDFYER